VVALVWLNGLLSLCLAVYALSALLHVVLYLLHRRDPPAPPEVPWEALPTVTVQIPVYNEVHVVERAIHAAAALDYPRERLQVLVLDDSDDETTAVAQACAGGYRARGFDISVLRRADRSGYKAGALAHALPHSKGEFIAIFDADFQPQPDFLLRTIPHLLARPELGFVQARWAFLNPDYSLLTRAQALAFDGYFVIEQTARSRAGLMLIFNGSAGVWRRACIEDAGGWQCDTLCEDLDLAFRAQAAGWRPLYLPDVAVPSELPPQIAAFKLQQARWAQGAAQSLRKLAPRLLRSKHLRWWQKGLGLIYLASYMAHPVALILIVLALPMLLLPHSPHWIVGGVLGLLYLGPPLIYLLAQQRLYRRGWLRLWPLPLLVLLGIGIAWSSAKATWRGLTRWGGPFVRTPKFHLHGRAGDWSSSSYRLRAGGHVVGEAALAVYALITAGVALALGQYGTLPFALLSAAAFGTVALLESLQSPRTRVRAPWQPSVARRATRRAP